MATANTMHAKLMTLCSKVAGISPDNQDLQSDQQGAAELSDYHQPRKWKAELLAEPRGPPPLGDSRRKSPQT